MPLNSSGQLSLGGATAGESVNLELGKAATAFITMNDTDLRTLFGIGAGAISMSNGYGKSSWTNQSTRGYFGGGGGYPFLGAFNAIDRFDFPSETISTLGAVLPAAASQNGVTGVNNSTKGYSNMLAGGGGTQSIRFADETAADVAADMPVQVSQQGEFQSVAKGYMGGGGFPQLNQIQALTFSTESYASIGAVIPYAVRNFAGVNSQSRGYWAGGETAAAPTGINDISGLIFSNESSIDPGAVLVQTRRGPRGVNSLTRGYFGGGRITPSGLNEIDGIIFDSETAINPGAALVQVRESVNTLNSATRGYFAGGTRGPSTLFQIDGIQFDSESTIDPAAGLNRPDGPFGVNNSNN
jgi:hypothetical protein